MTDWADRLEALRFDGEAVVESVPVGDGRVVVTSHRVLAFDPGGEPRFRAVDRPNVTGASVESSGSLRRLRQAARPAVVGVLLVVAAGLVPLDEAVAPVEAGGAAAAEVAPGLLSLLGLLALLDDALRAVGGFLLLLAVVLGWRYVRSRQRELVVEVAGASDARLAAPDAGEAAAAAATIREAARPD